jgi:hypothetical protein
VDIGGLAGGLNYTPGAVGNGQTSNIKKVNLTNNVILLDYSANTNYFRASGITGGFMNTASVTVDNVIVAKLSNSGTTTPEKFSGSVVGYTPSADAVYSLTDIWSVANLVNPTVMADASNKTVKVTDMADDAYWAANGAGMSDGLSKSTGLIPVPTTLSENAAMMASVQAYCADLKKAGYTADLNAGNVTSINSADDLVFYATLANQLGKAANVKLTANIDMADKTMPVFNKIKTFDGDGHVILNYTNTVICTTNADGASISTGGFCEALTGSIQNVAFVNYNVSFTTATPETAYEYFVGGLYGSGGNPTIKNVYMQGSLAITGTPKGNTRIGYFAAAHYNWNGDAGIGASIENSIFVGEVKGAPANYFGGDFGEAGAGEWNAILDAADGNGNQTIKRPQRQVKITNCYAIPYKTDAESGAVTLIGHVGNNIGLHSVALRNCYQTGLGKGQHLNHSGAVGYTNVVDENGNSLAYLDQFNVGDLANGVEIGALWQNNAFYILEQFQGLQADNAMKFSNAAEWTFFADGTPIPAVFGDNAAVLSIKSIDGMEPAIQKTVFTGAQLRLDKDGLRFVAEFDVAHHLIAAGDKTVEFGFLILPKVAITTYGQSLSYDNENVLKISTTDVDQLLAADDPRLADITLQNSSNKVLLAVMTQIPSNVLKSTTEFAVQPFVAYIDAQGEVTVIAEETNKQAYSGVYIANELCKNENVSDDVKKQVCGAFESANGFLYTWNEETNEMEKQLDVTSLTQIAYVTPTAFSVENRADYNANYMERNVVKTFQEELNNTFGTSIPLVSADAYLGENGVYACVNPTKGGSEYSITVTQTGNVKVEAGHYAALEEALEVLKAELVKNNGVLSKNYAKSATADIAVSGISGIFAEYGANVNNYKLVWNDEFNASSVDYDRWCFDGSNPAKGVDDIALSNSATTANGSLNMTTTLVNGVYNQSKLLTTFGTMNFNGGYLEMRGSIPYEAIGKWVGMWSTCSNSALFIKEWKADNNITGEGTYEIKPSDPVLGNGMGLEVDYVEVMSSGKKGGQSAVHLYPTERADGLREQNEDSFIFESESAALGYHTYGFFWNRDYMVFTIDGEVHYTFHLKGTGTDTDGHDYVNHNAKGYYQEGDFDPGKIALSLILQNDTFSPGYAAANDWFQSTTASNPYNATFSVDYVRLYQCEEDMLYLPREISEGVDANGNFNWNFTAYPAA